MVVEVCLGTLVAEVCMGWCWLRCACALTCMCGLVGEKCVRAYSGVLGYICRSAWGVK